MSIQRFRHVEDVPRPARAPLGQRADRIAAAHDAAIAMSGYSPPRGVLKFRSITEANAARTALNTESARARRAGQ